MYAQRFSDGPRFRPASLGAAIAINGAFVAALILANPDFVPKLKPEALLISFIPLPEPTPDPQPLPKAAAPRPQPTTPVMTPERKVVTQTPPDNPVIGETLIRDAVEPGTGTTGGTGTFPIDLPIVPKFIAAREDPRYIRDFQPPYPEYERDAGREGVVKLRIRIGADGRVKQVERIDGRDSFARISIAHALAKWRFEPATRGGVPEESWKVMTVRFTIDN